MEWTIEWTMEWNIGRQHSLFLSAIFGNKMAGSAIGIQAMISGHPEGHS